MNPILFLILFLFVVLIITSINNRLNKNKIKAELELERAKERKLELERERERERLREKLRERIKREREGPGISDIYKQAVDTRKSREIMEQRIERILMEQKEIQSEFLTNEDMKIQ